MPVLHTTVPYAWRRQLSLVRPVLGILCTGLYLLRPFPESTWGAVAAALYSLYALFLFFRDKVESSLYPPSVLLLDLAFLVVAALHPGLPGTWLTITIYFFLLLFGTLLYDWKSVTVVSAAACSLIFLFRTSGSIDSLGLSAGLAAIFAILMSLHKGQLQDRLMAALKRSVLSRAEADTARENERQRIAGDFHDGPMQSFISFQMRLEVIKKQLARDNDAGLRELYQLQDLGRSQVTELRAFVRNMQPAEVKPSDLQSAVRECVDHFERDSGITAEVVCGNLSLIDQETAAELLQVIREALNNVRKHSKASCVTIMVDTSSNDIEVAVDDDGSGFSFSGSYTLDELEILRLGPRSIKRRVRTLGGDMVLESRPTQGASLKIRLPAHR